MLLLTRVVAVGYGNIIVTLMVTDNVKIMVRPDVCIGYLMNYITGQFQKDYVYYINAIFLVAAIQNICT